MLLPVALQIPALCAGLLLIALEFCRPGWVVPLCTGGLLLTAALWSLAHQQQATLLDLALLLLTVLILCKLLALARRAKRNKQIV